MKIHNVEQGSDEWLQLRAGLVTASELDSLVSPTGKIRTGDGVQTYLARKLAERWHGGPLQTFSGGAMEQGSILEDEAIPFLELELNVDLQRPGFLTVDDGSFGCSPDAVAIYGCEPYGLEIKCPEPTHHVKWLLLDDVPSDHYMQCMGGMYVTGYTEWAFVSYRRGFPKLIQIVRRDAELMNTIEDALAKFNKSMDDGWKMLVDKNGGPPKRRTPRAVPDAHDPFAAAPVGTKPDFEVKL